MAAEFEIAIDNQPSIPGLYIPSHRPAYFHQQVTQIPTLIEPTQQLFQSYVNEIVSRYSPNTAVRSPSFRIKEALIAWATFGYGNEVLTRDEEAVRTFEGFEEKLHGVLPPSLGFRRLRIEMPEVVLETRAGRFSLDAVSGGIAALIDLTWQVYLRSLLATEFVVVIDEPENHLHPELQRRVFPSFVASFPQCQFITATHNPFIVGSVRDSNVYVLDYNEENRVESSLLDTINKAGSANEILRDALGLEFTMPVWVEEGVSQVLSRFSDAPLTDETVRAVKDQMQTFGLEGLFPETVSRLAEEEG